MRERLYYKITDENRKDLTDALKIEAKYSRKIPILNVDGEVIAKTSKFVIYTNYVDFYLDDYLEEGLTEIPGCIKNISIKENENLKGQKFKKIDTITA